MTCSVVHVADMRIDSCTDMRATARQRVLTLLCSSPASAAGRPAPPPRAAAHVRSGPACPATARIPAPSRSAGWTCAGSATAPPACPTPGSATTTTSSKSPWTPRNTSESFLFCFPPTLVFCISAPTNILLELEAIVVVA